MSAEEESKTEPKVEEEAKAEDMETDKTEVKEDSKAETKEEEAPEKKEPEKPVEAEEDAVADSRSKIADKVAFRTADATLNFMPTADDKLLMALRDGGLQNLLAASRANVGIKSGRYMFEVQIVENISAMEPQVNNQQNPQPKKKSCVRIGFSTAGSSLFLSDGADNVSFDSEGFFVHEKKRQKDGQHFNRGDTVALLLNLVDASPNSNTLSLFKNGQRASKPVPLPENLVGKALFPTITYKGVTLQVNFGGQGPCVPLPFECHMVQDAAKADVEVATPIPAPTNGKYEVLFPVGMPNEGAFDWVDMFVKENPQYTELSDRKILDWAQKSGLFRQKGYAWRTTNDKPEMQVGVAGIDDLTTKKILMSIAPTLKRNFIVMELKTNLIASERKASLDRFRSANFKKVAAVCMGEPTQDYKDRVRELITEEKKEVILVEKRKKAAEAERLKLLEQRKKKVEQAKKARMAALKKKKGEDDAEEEEVEENEDKEEDVEMEDDPVVELTDEEKKLWYRKTGTPDISEKALSTSFSKFSIPEESEGFDEIRYLWKPQDDCKTYLSQYVLNLKKTQRCETLKPGTWFTEEHKKFQKLIGDWKRRQTDWKDPARKKQLLAKLKTELAKKKAEEAGEDEDAKKEPVELPEVDVEDLDVASVEDVTNIGSGEPLFSEFAYEDWALLSFRYECHLLMHAFRKDMDDPDRASIPEAHFAYYYQKYLNKTFDLKTFALANMQELVDLVKEHISLSDSMLEPVCGDGEAPESFVKYSEENRRERLRRVDAGDETALLKFLRVAPGAPSRTGAQQNGGGSYGGKGGYGGGAGAYGAQKRPAPYGAPPPAQYARTSYGVPSAYGSAYARGGSPYGRR